MQCECKYELEIVYSCFKRESSKFLEILWYLLIRLIVFLAQTH